MAYNKNVHLLTNTNAIRIAFALDRENRKATEEERNGLMTSDEQASFSKEDKCTEDFEASMSDDFNTANAISAIFELVRLTNTRIQAGISAPVAETSQRMLESLCDILGLDLEANENGGESTENTEIEALVNQRQEARAQKNWAEADRLRDLLLSQYNVVLEDTPTGARWSKK